MKVRVIAHRGFSGVYPENTLLAFEKAVELGVDEIEFDIRMTRDGYPVIIHDETLDRTTDGKGKIYDLTLKEIKNFDAGIKFGEKFKGLKIPTFEEALDVIPEKIELNLHTISNPALIEKMLKILIERKRENFYFAIDSSMIPVAKKIKSDVKICNMRYQSDPWEYIEETKKVKAERLQFFNPSYEVTKDMVEKAHSYGIFVNVFFADTKEDMLKHINIGVDAILTNYPDILIKLVKYGE